ncbi:MAG TPA: SIR2 family protein [Bacteroidales bacterium]|nr:SIR2 family protein [Bacteroidales bacterium]
MKLAMIVGNGFNYLVSDLIRNYENQRTSNEEELQEIAKSIDGITRLWERFDDVFRDLREKSNGLNDEEVIRMIYTVLDFFSSIEGFKQILQQEDIESLKNIFDGFLLNKIREISNELTKHQDNAGYSELKRLFPNFGHNFFNLIEEKEVEKLHIYSTNYDGILDTLLTDDKRGGFVTRDGFSRGAGPENIFLDLVPEYIDEKYLLAHLHGSYKFKKHYGKTLKLRNNDFNDSPVMIFNNPDTKQDLILDDNVLRHYYNQLSEDLEKYDKLVIFGNSMKTEPHIKELINKYFNDKGKCIVVVSPHPEEIADELEHIFNHEVIEVSTCGISNEEDLLKLFEEKIL